MPYEVSNTASAYSEITDLILDSLLMWDHTEGIDGTAKLTNHEMWSHYSNFDGVYCEITDLLVALTVSQ